jgi:hypothetical protein
MLAMLTGCAAIAAGAIGTVIGNVGADMIEGKYPSKDK